MNILVRSYIVPGEERWSVPTAKTVAMLIDVVTGRKPTGGLTPYSKTILLLLWAGF